MSLEQQLADIQRTLGSLAAKSESAVEDRRDIKASVIGVHQRLDDLAGLPTAFAAHEQLDNERHKDNTGRLDKIEGRLASMEGADRERAGMRRGIGIGLAAASAAGGGGLVAGAMTLLKKWGFL